MIVIAVKQASRSLTVLALQEEHNGEICCRPICMMLCERCPRRWNTGGFSMITYCKEIFSRADEVVFETAPFNHSGTSPRDVRLSKPGKPGRQTT